jgi:uncharacterized protein
MKIAVIGATGNVGTRIVDEALSRGHSVTAIARKVGKFANDRKLNYVASDVAQPEELASVLAGHDVVVSSVGFRVSKPADFLEAVRRSGVERYLIVGGAGSLTSPHGGLHVNSPNFPALYRDEALGGLAFLEALRGVDDLDWTMLCPSALFVAGTRTDRFRLGTDELLTDANGKSWISYEDYSIALLDEIEKPHHICSRFTVGY